MSTTTTAPPRIFQRHENLSWLLSLCILGCGGLSEAATRAPEHPSLPERLAQRASGPTLQDVDDDPPPVFQALVLAARDRAAAPAPESDLLRDGHPLTRLDYDEYRRIRFRPEQSLLQAEGSRFEVQLFHLGWLSRAPVQIYLTDARASAQTTVRVPYSAELFSYNDGPLPAGFQAPAFSGLRLHAPINRDDYFDEVIVFQGASYFRSLGANQVYGLSARGLAIDTGASTAEEFPRFDAFYLVPPARHADHMWVLASLTSRRAEGAFAFRIHPGETTVVDVTAAIFLREGHGESIEALGLAPLSSMFLFGEQSPARGGDFRPEVHDSDALVSISGAGEQLSRALRNPADTAVSTLRLDSPRGFGLLQRDRAFSSYEDLEARYQDRPSVWIEPVGDWGPGALRLLEIATELETDDNIAAMWVPETIPDDGLHVRYRMHFGERVGPDSLDGPARAVATRIQSLGEGRARFLIDFVGGPLRANSSAEAHVSASGAQIVEWHVEANPHTDGVRVSFEVEARAAANDAELRAYIETGPDTAPVASETWSYRWEPAP